MNTLASARVSASTVPVEPIEHPPRSPSSSTFVTLSKGIPIFFEPGFHRGTVRGFHYADHFPFRQFSKAAIAFVRWVLLPSMSELSELIGRELAWWNRVSALEFRHDAPPF
jgi:hypothetical protein